MRSNRIYLACSLIFLIIALFNLCIPSVTNVHGEPSSSLEEKKYISYKYPSIHLKLDFSSSRNIRMELEIRDGRNESQPLTPLNWTNTMRFGNMHVPDARKIVAAANGYETIEDFIVRGVIRSSYNISLDVNISLLEGFLNKSLHIIRIEANVTMARGTPWKFRILPFLDRAKGRKLPEDIPHKVNIEMKAKCGDDTWFQISPTPDKHLRTRNGVKLEMWGRYGIDPMEKPYWILEVEKGDLLSPKWLFVSLTASLTLSLPIFIWRIWRLFRKREVFSIPGFILFASIVLLLVVTPLFYFYPGFTAGILFTLMIFQVIIPPLLFIPVFAKSRDRIKDFETQKREEKKKIRHQMSEVMGATPEQVDRLVSEIDGLKKGARHRKRRKRGEPLILDEEKIIDPHEILGIPSGSDIRDVEKAYKNMIKQYHPDLYEDLPIRMKKFAQSELKKIIWAYETIKGNE